MEVKSLISDTFSSVCFIDGGQVPVAGNIAYSQESLRFFIPVGEESSVGNEYVRYSNISDEASLSLVDGTESQNIVAKQAGTYTFTYRPDTKLFAIITVFRIIYVRPRERSQGKRIITRYRTFDIGGNLYVYLSSRYERIDGRICGIKQLYKTIVSAAGNTVHGIYILHHIYLPSW